MRHVSLALLVLVAAATARAEGLTALLEGVAANARFEPPMRADVRIACTPPCGERRAILLGRGDAVYVEVKDGPRALVRPDAVEVRGTPAGGTLPGTDVRLEDLAVFRANSLRFPQISDDTPSELVVTGAPAVVSSYALLVHTIDRERRVIAKTQYYTGSISNLVKIRRDGGWVEAAGHWRPTTVTVQAIERDTTATLTLSWREAADAPAALFEPGGLEKPSGLVWE